MYGTLDCPVNRLWDLHVDGWMRKAVGEQHLSDMKEPGLCWREFEPWGDCSRGLNQSSDKCWGQLTLQSSLFLRPAVQISLSHHWNPFQWWIGVKCFLLAEENSWRKTQFPTLAAAGTLKAAVLTKYTRQMLKEMKSVGTYLLFHKIIFGRWVTEVTLKKWELRQLVRSYCCYYYI